MMTRLVWKTASNHYAGLLSLSESGEGIKILTTVSESQTGGSLKLYWEKGIDRSPAASIKITGLPPNSPGDPVLSIKTVYNGRKKLEIIISSEKREYLRKIFSVPLKYRSRKIALFLIIPAILLLAGGSLIMLLNHLKEPFVPPSDSLERNISDSSETSNNFLPEIVPPSTEAGSGLMNEEPPPKNEVTEITEKPTLEFSEITILFEPEKSEILPEAITQLDKLIETLSADDIPNLSFTGHCALFGTTDERMKLSLKRAEVIADYFKQNGIDLPSSVRISGRGGENPFSREENKQNLNRRVVIELFP